MKKSLFAIPTAQEQELINKINALLDKQESLKVHHYRTDITDMTDDDREFDEIEEQIKELNNLRNI